MEPGRNLSLKIAAVVIAFLFWAWVAGQGDVLKTMRVPLDLTGLPPDMEIVGETADEVTVRLRGSEIALRSLSPERLRVLVNLATLPLESGNNEVPISISQVRVPAGIEVDRISPNLLEVNLQKKATREVPVRAEVRGRPAAGFVVAEVAVEPPRVLIEGPESAVRQVKSALTPAISIDGANSSQALRVRPIVIGPAGTQIRLADPSAMVTVRVRIRPVGSEPAGDTPKPGAAALLTPRKPSSTPAVPQASDGT